VLSSSKHGFYFPLVPVLRLSKHEDLPLRGEEILFEAWVYMLRCSDGLYYVGSTRSSLEARVAEQNGGTFGGFTSSRRPIVLVWSQPFARILDAIAAERQLKGWSRAKKEALIRGDYEMLPALSRGGRANAGRPSTE